MILSRVPVPSGAIFLIRRDAVEITTYQVLRYELKLPDDDEDLNRLQPPTTVLWEEFQNEPLSAALARIAEEAETSILIDPNVKQKAATKLTVTLRNVPLDDALELLANMAGLVVVTRTNAYYVTTPANAAQMRLLSTRKAVVRVALNNGVSLNLTVSESQLIGYGEATNGRARFPMSVTSGAVRGNDLVLQGIFNGDRGMKAPYSLAVNRRNATASWVVGTQQKAVNGRASVGFTR
jgi:hypothetical protein